MSDEVSTRLYCCSTEFEDASICGCDTEPDEVGRDEIFAFFSIIASQGGKQKLF